MNISVYVSGGAGRIIRILQDHYHEVSSSIKLIYYDGDSNIMLSELCQELNISYIHNRFHTLKFDERDPNLALSNHMLSVFEESTIDYCFCFGDHILKGPLLEVFRNRIINFHPSVLPLFPGRKSIDQAMERNVFFLGNTAHFIDQGIDTGPIIMQNFISSYRFYENGYDGVLNEQIPMFLKIVDWLMDNRIRVKDRSVIIDGANYTDSYFFPS